MKTSNYLYGVPDAEAWSNMSYREALEKKIALAKALINQLQTTSIMERDSTRIVDCLNAIRFNEQLLKE